MITITKEETLYEYNELTEDAKEKAYNSWWESESSDFAWMGEIRDVIEDFKETFKDYIDKFDWEFDTCNYWCRLTTNYVPGDHNLGWGSYSYENEITGVRLATWLYNNYDWYIYQYKTYYKNKNSRKSKITREIACPTGYYLGEVVTRELESFIKNPSPGWTLEDVLQDVFKELIKSAQEDYESSLSKEIFEEWAKDNEYLFNENGNCTYMMKSELES